jgi:hypothetical protein
MAANSYSLICAALAAELLTDLAPSYSGLVVSKRHFKPDNLPENFTRYAIIVSPGGRPWDERRTAVREIQYIFRADLFLLVQNFDPDLSLFGTGLSEADPRGLFQMVSDVKDALRLSTLGGILDKTYDEPGGDPSKNGGGGVEFQSLASPAFDTGNYPIVHRARIPFVARTMPFCHDR